ncbi:MAG: lipopolysaccharide biosynthesis protein [Planctomycetota bacterium]
MGLRERAIQGVVWSALRVCGGNAISFFVQILLVRLLAPKSFGLVALAIVFTALLRTLQDQGLTKALIQRKDLEPQHLDSAFWVMLAAGAVMTSLCVILAGPIATALGEPRLAEILPWLALNLVIGSFGSVQAALLTRRMRFKSLALRSLSGTFAGGVVGVVMAFSGFGIWSLIGLRLVDAVVATIALWSLSSWRPSLSFSIRHFKEIFGFGANAMGIALLNWSEKHLDNLLIGIFLNAKSLGFFAIARAMVRRVNSALTISVADVALPTFSRMQTERDRMGDAFLTATQVVAVVAFPSFLGMLVVTPDFVLTLFGERWTPSIPLMQILCLGMLLPAVTHFTGPVIMACGRPSWLLSIKMVGLVVRVAAFLIGVRWGLIGIAVALVSARYVMLPVSLTLAMRLTNLRAARLRRRLAGPLIAALGMSAAVTALRLSIEDHTTPALRLALCTAAGMASYALLLGVVARPQATLVLDLVRSALSRPPKT